MHPRKFLLRAALTGLAIPIVFACDSGVQPPSPTSLVLSGTDTLVSIRDTATFRVEVRDQHEQPMVDVAVDSIASSDPSTVFVTPAGFATALRNGSATITAYARALSASKTVVVWQKVFGVIVSGPDHFDSVGAVIQLTAEAMDSRQNKIYGRPVRWSSSYPVNATIDSVTGVATAHHWGIVQLRATIESHFAQYQVAIWGTP